MSVDLSLPLSIVVREATKVAHENVRLSPIAGALFRGQLPREYYVRYLMLLWHIYDAIERGLERHSEHPTIEPIYNPAVFARAPGLSADISCLLDVPESEWHSHPIHQSLLSPTIPPALQQFLSRLERLSFSSTPAPLLAHAYTRYMGDLGGGQSIRVGMAKAYGLDVHGQGVEFYLFKQLDCSAKATTQGELKKIKDWFRAGMDRAAGDDAALKSVIAEEANLAFAYAQEIFDLVVPVVDNGEGGEFKETVEPRVAVAV